jgi:hypothetical protein
MPKILEDQISQCEHAASALGGLTLRQQLLQGLEGERIGIIRLLDGQTLGIEIADGCISREGKKITEIPSLDVIRTSEALIEHLNNTTDLRVVSLEVPDSDRPQSM